MRRSRWLGLFLALAVALAAFWAPPVLAADDYPYAGDPATEVDPWQFFKRECTSFVAWRLNDAGGVNFHNNMNGGHWGNAHEWDENAAALGYRVDTVPAVGSVAHWNSYEAGAGSAGHVAYVSSVNADGSALIEEYNWLNEHAFSSRTVRAPRYIHIADVPPPSGIGLEMGGEGPVWLEAHKTASTADTITVSLRLSNIYASWYSVQGIYPPGRGLDAKNFPRPVVVGPGADIDIGSVTLRAGESVELAATRAPTARSERVDYWLVAATHIFVRVVLGENLPPDMFWNLRSGRADQIFSPEVFAILVDLLPARDLNKMMVHAQTGNAAGAADALIDVLDKCQGECKAALMNMLDNVRLYLGKGAITFGFKKIIRFLASRLAIVQLAVDEVLVDLVDIRGPVSGSTWVRAVPMAQPGTTMYEVGHGATNKAAYARAFADAGGTAVLGTPANAVHRWDPGCIQDFLGGTEVKSAIMSHGCAGDAWAVSGPFWGYLESNYGGEAAAVVGYPYNDRHVWANGWVQDFDHGRLGPTILMQRNGSASVFKVFRGIRDKYVEAEGALGALGYPTSDEYDWNGEKRQDFEGGSIVWNATGGARILWPPPASYRFYVAGTCADGLCGLNKRSGPGYSAYSKVGVLVDGDAVDIACQTTGEWVHPNRGTPSNVWDRLTDGSYVTDVYVTTGGKGGAFTPPIPRC